MTERRPLRVALVGPAPGRIGGTARLIELLERHLSRGGVEARSVATDAIPSWAPPWLDRVRYLRTALRFAAYQVRLLRAAFWADVIHAFASAGLNFLLEPLPAVLIGRILGRRVVLNYHTGKAPDHLRRWRWLVRWAANRADVFVVPSPFLARIFADAGIPTVVVPNLVEAPDRVGTQAKGRVILNTRSLEPLYDLPTCLRAFGLVQARHPDMLLILLAGGSEERRLRRLAAELGLREVEFVGGVAHEEVPTYLARASLFLNSSRVDNQPLSILEAFASGVPVVSTDAGGIPDIVRHGETGLLAPVGDYRALAERACHVLDDPALAQRLTRAGRAVAAAHGWNRLRDSWLRVYGADRERLSGEARAAAAAGSGVRE